jgi:hypothetical protein
MKTDWRIIGRPYRGARRTVVLKSGYATKDQASAAMASGIEAGGVDPNAWVQSCRVRDDYDPTVAEQNRRIVMS